MSKPFTDHDLAAQLTQDINWRIREISDLKSAVLGADSIARPVLLRSIVAIGYAHWEGHVRFSANKFLTHVALRKLPFAVLQRQFLRNDFLPRLATIGNKSITERGQLVDQILVGESNRFARVNESLINTRANLNFEVLIDICTICGIDLAVFAGQETFIDILLLKRRNAIAHGEDTLIDIGELNDLSDGVVALMRTFSNELQSSAYLESYRAA